MMLSVFVSPRASTLHAIGESDFQMSRLIIFVRVTSEYFCRLLHDVQTLMTHTPVTIYGLLDVQELARRHDGTFQVIV